MSYEYKTVGAPEKGKRNRGARSASDRAAAAFNEVLQTEAVDGWEYLRTDILPVTERRSWLGGSQEAHRAVMVFRRTVEEAQQARSELRADPRMAPRPEAEVQLRAEPEVARAGRREPDVNADPDLRLAEVVRGPSRPKPDDR